jgi:hypothetical protein
MWSYFSRCNTSRQSTSSVCGHGADCQFQVCGGVRVSEVYFLRSATQTIQAETKPQLSGVLVCLERAFYFINLEPVNFAHCGLVSTLW